MTIANEICREYSKVTQHLANIHDLVFNLLCIVVPIFLFQFFWGDRISGASVRARLSILLMSAASLLLCMTFPVAVEPGYLFDLRLVPFLLATLYCGPRTGAILLALLLVYRYWIGEGLDSDFRLVSAQFPALLLIASLLSKRFRSSALAQKTCIALTLVLVVTAVPNSMILSSMDQPLLENPLAPMILVFIPLNVFATWIALYLIENMLEKNRLREEIVRAEKLHMLGELTASIAHEIRNPLTVVNGFLQLLRENDGRIGEEKRQLYLKMGIDELDRAEKIIANYLSFARPQLESVERIDMAERVDHAASIITSFALLRNVQIEKQAEDGLHVSADPEKISQVLMNLLKNGVEAMPQGGTLTVQARKSADRVLVSVRDTGIGMSIAETAKLGVPYYSTKQAGTGLGLMVCYQIVHSLGGTIHVTSEKNKGTQFLIVLPAA